MLSCNLMWQTIAYVSDNSCQLPERLPVGMIASFLPTNPNPTRGGPPESSAVSISCNTTAGTYRCGARLRAAQSASHATLLQVQIKFSKGGYFFTLEGWSRGQLKILTSVVTQPVLSFEFNFQDTGLFLLLLRSTTLLLCTVNPMELSTWISTHYA